MTIETVYLSQKDKDQLAKLKRVTGIQNWNILCRWAFCTSLRQKDGSIGTYSSSDNTLEIAWKVFGGQFQDIYMALLKEITVKAGLSLTKENMTHVLRFHINNGLRLLSDDKKINRIESLLRVTS